MSMNLPQTSPTPEQRKAMQDIWIRPNRNLPPPQDLEPVKVKLVAAALKGKAEFNRVWNDIFHGKYPSPGARAYVKPGLRKAARSKAP